MENNGLTIDQRIRELTMKADLAQKTGNIALMEEIDAQIRQLQEAKWELFKNAYPEEEGVKQM